MSENEHKSRSTKTFSSQIYCNAWMFRFFLTMSTYLFASYRERV
jgi:hypothetical protein